MKKLVGVPIVVSFILGCLLGCRSTLPPENPVDDLAGNYYTVRGEIVNITPVTLEAYYLTLLHEPIDNFRNEKGELVGMEAMSMTFAVKKGVSVEGLRPEDKVEVRFRVRWDRAPAMQITSLQRLDPAVELELHGYSLEPSGSLMPPPLKQLFSDADSLQ